MQREPDVSAWVLPAVLIWLLVGIAAAAVAVLLVYQDHKQAELTIRTPPAVAAPTSPGAAPTVEIRMIPTIRFDASELRVRQGEVTVRADNADAPLSHDWALYQSRGEAEGGAKPIASTKICSAPCTDDVTFSTPPPGEYFFRCQIHPQQMFGKFIVE
jgi:plastocyanin